MITYVYPDKPLTSGEGQIVAGHISHLGHVVFHVASGALLKIWVHPTFISPELQAFKEKVLASKPKSMGDVTRRELVNLSGRMAQHFRNNSVPEPFIVIKNWAEYYNIKLPEA